MTGRSRWVIVLGLAALLLGAVPAWGSAETGDEIGEETGEETGEDPAATADPIASVFPDPTLLRRGKTYRGIGAALSITGAVAFVAGFNIALAVIRSGNETALSSLPYYLIPTSVLMVAGLEIGAPLWSVGGSMVRQLTRNTKGDEKLRRPVANDPRYWQGQMLHAFGTAMALTGGMAIMVGSLVLVGSIWIVQREAEFAERGFDAGRPWLIAGPIAAVGVGTALLITGLKTSKTGLDRSRKVRDAYATTQLFPIPTFDPVNRSAGLALVGRF